MTQVRVIQRPYTHPSIKNPTYPVLRGHSIVEATWEQIKPQPNLEERIARIEAELGIKWG